MIPLHLRLSGFLSYRDPVEVDFTQFDLACISGPNGAGKSSLLDAITWALFGQARKRDDSIINSHADAAEVIMDFDYEGGTYRIQRSKPREKQTLLEFFILDLEGNWKPLTEKSLRETEGRIESVLRMDYETFTNASFFLQGKADQFAQQRPSDRKRILSSIMGLEIWETYRAATAERRKTLETDVTNLEGRLHEIGAELSEEPGRRARLAELEARLAHVAQARAAQETALENLRRLAASLGDQRRLVETLAGQFEHARQSLTEIRQRLEERVAERDIFAAEMQHAAEIEAAYASWQACRTELEHWDSIAERFREQEKKRSSPLLEIEAARASLQAEQKSLQESGQCVAQDATELPALNSQLNQAQNLAAQQQEKLERRASLDKDYRELHRMQADARAENPRLSAEMKELKDRIDRLSEAGGGNCPLCGQPLSETDREALIASLETHGKSLGDRYRENRELLKSFEAQSAQLEHELSSLSGAEKALMEHNRRIDQLTSRVKEIQTRAEEWRAQGAPRLEAIGLDLSENRYAPEPFARLAKIDEELKAFGYDAATHDSIRRAEMDGRSSEAKLRALEKARAALTPLEREIAGLQQQVQAQQEEVDRQQVAYDQARAAYQAAAENLPDVDAAERSLLGLVEQENQVRMEVGAARQKVLVLDDLRARLEKLTAERDELNRRIGQYRTLERAFSKDGVPALLIEQALPEIEAQANEILDRLSGGSMSVQFATQKEYKDKNRSDLRETLDIIISDGAGRRDYEMFSGGEAFRVNFAIRLALSKVLAQRAGARLQTLVIDEGFGSQDAIGRQRLIEAINLVKQDFSKILVITHLEELKDAFPNRIEVEKGLNGSQVHIL